MYLAHAVLAVVLRRAVEILSLEFVGNADVKVAAVLGVGLDLKIALDRLAFLDSEDVLEVEDGLLPVSVLCVRASREANGLVAGGKVNVKPRDESVDKVIAFDGEVEWGAES